MKGEYSDLLSGYLNKENIVSKARFFDKWPYVTEKKSVTKSAEEKRKELENEDYKINIIDKNVVMFDINKNNSISIIENGGYKIIS